nr:carbonyl reductase [NADPH] 3-like [Peromyscus maniculatus bairdii]
MSSRNQVALVTGGNRGIGFAITRDLCRKFSGDVVLTARDEAPGQAAVQQLQAEGLSPRFHQLDIDDPQSIRALRDFLLEEYGGLDVLVNNAGISTWPKNKPPRRDDFFKDTQQGLSALGLAVQRDGGGSTFGLWRSQEVPREEQEQINIPVL